MRKRHQNPRLAKIHRSYTVDEIADLYRVAKNTVRHWIKQGLSTCDSKRPMLVLGSELNTFHEKRRTKNKRPCLLSEIYCVRCRVPKKPAAGMVEYQAMTPTSGNLIAICPDCETVIHRCISKINIPQIPYQIDILLPQPHLHIVESSKPSVNSDFSIGAKPHVKTPS